MDAAGSRPGSILDGPSLSPTIASPPDGVDPSAQDHGLKRIEWMLSQAKSHALDLRNSALPPYGDLTSLNTGGLIRSSIADSILTDIAVDYLSLLKTSSAIYEINGDYALGLFSSGWCRHLDNASRRLCGTDDNKTALCSGKWLCHESCWSEASKTAIAIRGPADIACAGGIRLYTIPILANNVVVGVINFGYGDPPQDPGELMKIATAYHVDYQELHQLALEYESRPPFIIEIAKERLLSSARLIGSMVESKIAERELRAERDRTQEYLDVVGVLIACVDAAGNLTMLNRRGCDLLGVQREAVLGKPWVDTFVPEASRQEVAGFLQKLIKGNPSFTEYFENLVQTARGERLIAWHNALMHDADGNCTGIVGSGEDITDRKQMEELLHLEKEQLEITLLSVGDGVISTDVEGRVRIINKAGEYLTGWTQREAQGHFFNEIFPIVDETSRPRVDNPVEQVLRSGKTVELAKHSLLITKYGLERPIEDSIAPIRDAHGNIKGVVVVFRDCSESRRKETEILWLSYHDQLTGLHNRRSYEYEVHRLDDCAYYPLALVMADVNGLKLTNDAFGHTAGDELLRKIAGMLAEAGRPGDIVARIGGDEFVMLLPRTSALQAEAFIHNLQATVNHASVHKLKISVSFGYAVKENPEEDMGDVFNRAEDDMYRHKLSESPSARTRTIELLLHSLFKKSNREMQHSRRVGDLCRSIALEAGLSADDAKDIRTAGLLHDIGKIAVESEILNKPASLDESEWLMIRRHPEVGYNILSSVAKYSSIAEFVLCHHEHWDGGGYPRGLKGDEIPLQARIIAVADTYDAMLSDRTYHKGRTQFEVLTELKNSAGLQLDPDITRLFVEKILNQPWE